MILGETDLVILIEADRRNLWRFRAKWTPARVKKARQNNI
jgi:hypothetical protein